jgi:ABC-2 type transport system permease protein
MMQFKQFVNLISNELYKMFFQKKTIFFIIFLVLTLGVSAFTYYHADEGNQWRAEATEQIEQLKMNIEEADTNKEDNLFQIDSSQEQLQLLEYRLEHDIPENVITPYRFIYNSKFFIGFIVFFITIFSANIISNEYSWGTIRQLLVRPVRRWKIYVAKYISAILVGVILITILLALSSILGFVLFSKNSTTMKDIVIMNGEIIERNMLSFTILSTLSNVFDIAIISALTFFIASIVKTTGLSIVISLGVYYGSYIVGALFSNIEISKYILTNNLSLSNYLPGQMIPFEGATITFSIIVCLVYLSIFLIGGMLFFTKRDVH